MPPEHWPSPLRAPEMGNGSGSDDKEPTKQDASARLMELIHRHGMANVPQEELERIGYRRTTEGRIMRHDALQEQQERAAKRLEQTPFEAITVELPLGRTDIYRAFGAEDDREMRKITKELNILEELLEDDPAVEDIIPRDKPYHVFRAKFLPYAEQIVETDESLVQLGIKPKPEYEQFRKSLSEEEQKLIDGAIFNYHYMSVHKGTFFNYSGVIPDWPDTDKNIASNLLEDEGWSKSGVEKVHERLERLKGRYADVPEMERSLKSMTYADRDDTEPGKIERMNLSPEKLPRFAEVGEVNLERKDTLFALARKVALVKFFEISGYDRIAQKIKGTNSFEGLERVLADATVDDLSSVQEFREINRLMKDAKTIEEKKSLSARKKAADEAIKQEKIFLEGARQFVNPAPEIARTLKNKITDIQDRFVASSAKSAGHIRLTLDGRYDPVLDRDPGVVSGDCTAGRPLPFSNINFPLFNVKVFSPERKHMGNMYLVVGAKEGKPVWHFDAIQIPYNIEWSAETVRALIEPIVQEAIKKGIAYITVNDDPPHISNYDYIGNAVMGYVERYGSGLDQPEYIELPEKLLPLSTGEDTDLPQSRLQGSGHCLVLWRNPNLQAPENLSVS